MDDKEAGIPSSTTALSSPVSIRLAPTPSPPTNKKGGGEAAAAERPTWVCLEDILDFVFVKKVLQHPQTTGRLLSLGLFGPLDLNKNLRSGKGGTHVVQPFEIDAMCAQFEREDLVQIYLPFGYPVSTLSQEEMQTIINQADPKLKTAKAKTFLPQATEEEVRALFRPLSTNESGLYSFHDLQRQIAKWRVDRIAKHKITYPSNLQEKPPEEHLDHSISISITKSGRGTPNASTIKSNGSSYRVSAKVAPPSMFIKNVGMTDQEVPDQTNLLLSHKTFQIADLSNSNSLDLSQNVRLLRELPSSRRSNRHRLHGKDWDDYSFFKDTQLGSYVKCARSKSTCKRHITIA